VRLGAQGFTARRVLSYVGGEKRGRSGKAGVVGEGAACLHPGTRLLRPRVILPPCAERDEAVAGCLLRLYATATELVRRRLEFDRLDVKLAGSIGLVAIPVLDHELSHLAIDEELERLVADLLAHDGVDAHGGEPIAAEGCLARRHAPPT
jgi:hypothetical protein